MKKPYGRKNLNPKKVRKRTKTRNKKLVTKMSPNIGNVLKTISSDGRVVNLQKKRV